MAVLIWIIGTLIAISKHALASQKTVMFGIGIESDVGTYPTVSLDRHNRIIQAQESKGNIFYKIGELHSGLFVNWTRSSSLLTSGTHPAIASNDNGFVVLVYEQASWKPGVSQLWCKLGQFNTSVNAIDWSESFRYDEGALPTVALTSDGTIVEAHQTATEVYRLFYRTGRISRQSNGSFGISLQTAIQFPFDGSNIAIGVNFLGDVVEVHQSPGPLLPLCKLWQSRGLLDNGTLVWSEEPTINYADGINPAVALTDEGLVVEAHEAHDLGMLWSSVGQLARSYRLTNSIKWSTWQKFDEGSNVAIAVSGASAIQIHRGRWKRQTLWHSTSLILDRSNWMQASPAIWNKPLWQVTLPATHDSGAYSLTDAKVRSECGDVPAYVSGDVTKLYALTQSQSIFAQLMNGIRFFDIRPYFWPKQVSNDNRTKFFGLAVKVGDSGDFHVYHENIGPTITDVLTDIERFLRTHRRELVILTFTHFCMDNFNIARHEELTRLINQTIGPYLYKREWSQNLTQTRMSDFLGDGPKVILTYEDPFVQKLGSGSGFWPTLPRFDEYSNTEDFAVMKANQLAKLVANPGSKDQLFLLSWTLTWNGDILSNIHSLSKPANKELSHFVERYARRYQINFLYVDYFEDARVTDLAVVINNA